MRASAFSAHLAISRSRWRLLLAAVLAVAAVVVGLFTMHSMAGSAAHHETGSPTTATQSVPAHEHAGDATPMVASADPAEHHDAVLSIACDEACQMGCLMVGLICTLQLLAVLVAFLLPRVASAVSGFMNIARRVVSAMLSGVAPPRPPSLTALSISRT